MSFLQKIWDETLAGPPPDSGLGRLRKYNSFSAQRSPPMISIPPTPALSHAHSTLPSPRTPHPITTTDTPETPRGDHDDMKRLVTRRSSVDFPRQRPLEVPQPTTPSVYDWIVITALDR